MTLVNMTIEVSSVHLYNIRSIYYTVYPPTTVKLSSVDICMCMFTCIFISTIYFCVYASFK